MKTRDLTLALAAPLLLAGLCWLGFGAEATAVVGAGRPVPAPEAALPEPEEPEPKPVDGETPPIVPLTPRTAPTTTGWTHGVIRGHISLGSLAIRKIDTVYIQVQEAINGPPGFAHTEPVPIEPKGGLPDFSISNIPFSQFGYMVTAYAEKVNGTEQFVQVTKDNPIADVILGVTGGVAFTVLVKDQLHAPLDARTVLMVPVGKPLGRPSLRKDSNNFGAAVFSDVLQGDYEIHIGSVTASENDPTVVNIQAHAGIASTTVIVPDGHDLQVRVQARGGWGLQDASIEILQTDTVQFRRYEGTADYAGLYKVKLTPGEYQINVRAEGYGPWSRKVKVKADEQPKPVDATLSRR